MHVRVEDGRELAGVEVPPAAEAAVVAWCWFLAVGTEECSVVGGLNADSYALLLHIELDISIYPWAAESEDLGIQVAVAHGRQGIPVRPLPLSILKSRLRSAILPALLPQTYTEPGSPSLASVSRVIVCISLPACWSHSTMETSTPGCTPLRSS